jgi:hypothetical protein
MVIPSAKNLVCIVFLALAILACTFSAPSSAPEGAEPAVPPEATAATTIVESSPPPESSSVGSIGFTESDPCTLMTKESAETAMGQSVDEPIQASNSAVVSCTYIAVPGEKFVTVAVYEGENAKNYLLNEISQLQAGCELRMSTGEQPTTFPPEVEALRSQSMLDLFLRDLEVQKGCGGSYAQVTDLGNNAYTFQTFIVGAVIGVATEDAFITFLVGDISMTPERALEAAKGLVQRAASP